MRVLIFAPHPDDEVIGCGGSILMHVAQGGDVHVAFLTSGERAMSTLPIEENGSNREREAIAAGEVLGVRHHHFLRLRDTFIEPDANAVEAVVQVIRETQPDWVYVTHAQEALHDHATSYALVTKALAIAARPSRMGPASRPSRILAYEVWTPIQAPTYVVDISAHIDRKLDALRMYRMELASRPYDQIAEALSRYRGLTLTSGTHAEVFTVVALRD